MDGALDRKNLPNFYSRPCGRGDPAIRRSAIGISSISTHAPAGGATFLSLVGGALPRQISTHAPAGGATRIHREGV